MLFRSVLRAERRERLALQARLMPGSPLIKYRLLLLHPAEGTETHTARRLMPAPRLLRWLLEEEELPREGGEIQEGGGMLHAKGLPNPRKIPF